MRLLLTRPALDAEGSRRTLIAMGHQVAIAPLIDIQFREDVDLPALAWQALLVTSGNAARALALHGEAARLRMLPVFAVGDQSAARLQELGFHQVESADGDVHALASLVRRRLDPAGGPLLHVAGSVRAGDLVTMLSEFDCKRVVLYDAMAATALPPQLERELMSGEVEGVLFYSPRTARIFSALLTQPALLERLSGMIAYCLSPAVAASLPRDRFRHIRVAMEPKESALLHLIEKEAGQAD